VNRKFGILGIIALALLLGSTGALAQARDQLISPHLPAGVGEKVLYDRTTILPKVERKVELPVPSDDLPVVSNVTFKGPSDSFGSVLLAEPGMAMLTPRGGAMSSPKQVADRQIRRLINRLD
jgi:hypothetical protein